MPKRRHQKKEQEGRTYRGFGCLAGMSTMCSKLELPRPQPKVLEEKRPVEERKNTRSWTFSWMGNSSTKETHSEKELSPKEHSPKGLLPGHMSEATAACGKKDDICVKDHTPRLDCEWMFGDCATGNIGFQELSYLNPLRWSRSLTIPEAIRELSLVLPHGDRPIILKCPSGVSSKMHNCATIEEAIQFLLEKEPIINNLCSPSTHAPSLPSSQDEDELYPSSRPAAYCARLRTACRFLSPSRDKPSSGRLLTNIVQAHEQRCNKRQEHKTQMCELITTNGKNWWWNSATAD